MKRHYKLLILLIFFTLLSCDNLIKETENATVFEKVFSLCTAFLGPIITIIGLWITIPIIRKRLAAEHISDKIKEIQIANSEIHIVVQQLIDKYTILLDEVGFITEENIERVNKDLEKGFDIVQKSSSDVATVMFYLKVTLQEVLKYYSSKQDIKNLQCKDFYIFLINVLNFISYYSMRVVQIPKSSKIKNKYLIKKKFRKFVTKSQIKEFRHFNIGAFHDPDSFHYLRFCDFINTTKNPSFMKSAFLIYHNPNAIAKILSFEKKYAPSIIDKQVPKEQISVEENVYMSKSLYLIGFVINKIYSNDTLTNPTHYVDLVYFKHTNLETIPAWDQLKIEFVDKWIPESGFDISKSTKYDSEKIGQIITLRYESSILEKYYKLNRVRINKKLKIVKS